MKKSVLEVTERTDSFCDVDTNTKAQKETKGRARESTLYFGQLTNSRGSYCPQPPVTVHSPITFSHTQGEGIDWPK